MAYASLQTLTDQYGLDAVTLAADRDGDGAADAGVVARALEHADGIINSRVGVKYQVPVNPVPAVLTAYAGDIALYFMSADTGALTEEKRRRYEDALRWLDAVAAGKAVLDGQPEPPSKEGPAQMRVVAEPREFTRTALGGIL